MDDNKHGVEVRGGWGAWGAVHVLVVLFSGSECAGRIGKGIVPSLIAPIQTQGTKVPREPWLPAVRLTHGTG